MDPARDREIVLERTFNVTPQQLFEAYTRPEQVRQWLLGPPGWSMPVCEIDLRPGGAYRYRWRSDAGDQEFGVSGTYREVEPAVRLVHAERMEGMPGEALVTVRFAGVGTTTKLTMTISFDSKEAKDQAASSGMEQGIEASFDRLTELLAAQSGRD